VTPSWLGVVPARHSTGGKVKLPGISKHRDPGLRTLPITGAHSAVQTAHLCSDPTSQWLTRLREGLRVRAAAPSLDLSGKFSNSCPLERGFGVAPCSRHCQL
jgi:transposase